MIVDASAIVSIVFQEQDHDSYLTMLEESDSNLRIAPASLWEAFAKSLRSADPAHLTNFERVEDTVPLEIVPTDASQYAIACDAWRHYGKGSGHRAQLNFGDCFAYALAKTLDEPLLYKGDDFVHTDVRSAL